MNYHVVGRMICLLILVVGLCQAPALVCAGLYGEHEAAVNFGCSILLIISVGIAGLWFFRHSAEEMHRREAFAVVGLGWLLAIVAGALPFHFYGLRHPSYEFCSWVNCLYESASGFTTTGSTILTDIEKYPRSLLLWRGITCWLGGLGIIVFFVAVLPAVGHSAKQLYRGEVSGPNKDGLFPRIRTSAMALLYIYLFFTLLETLLLMIFGMSFFDAINHACATVSCGGFSTKNASVGYFKSDPNCNGLAIEWTIIFFLYISAINYNLHFTLLRRRKWREVLADGEWQFFSCMLIVAVFVFTVLIFIGGHFDSVFSSFRAALFQTVSMSATGGFVTADFDQWPEFCRYGLMLLMLVGGCAGSTAGGLKVMRVIFLCKLYPHHMRRIFSPHEVQKMHFNGLVVKEELLNNVLAFILLALLLIAGSSLLLTLHGYDITTSITACISNFSNAGTGLARVGATQNYAFFDARSKLLLSCLMIAGRLELYSLLLLFNPEFWRGQ